MPAGKLYYEALRKLPKRFISNKTLATVWAKDMIVAVNPDFPPIKYKDGSWQKIEVESING